LGFGIGASVVTNNIAALAALANGLLPMRRVAQLEAERRHILEMELRQGGWLRESGSPVRLADLSTELVPTAEDGVANLHRYHTALAAD
jgi:hypothetical protein